MRRVEQPFKKVVNSTDLTAFPPPIGMRIYNSSKRLIGVVIHHDRCSIRPSFTSCFNCKSGGIVTVMMLENNQTARWCRSLWE